MDLSIRIGSGTAGFGVFDVTDSPMTVEDEFTTFFVVGDRVYKLYKPVLLARVDLRDSSDRIAAVDREMLLGGRLSPAVHLGTADVLEKGELVDRMVILRRIPTERRLSTIVGRGELESHELERIARAVASFHASEGPVPDVAQYPADHRSRWRTIIDAIDPFSGPLLDSETTLQLDELVFSYLDHHAALFEGRVTGGYVREAHGDLRAEHVVLLDEGPQLVGASRLDVEPPTADVLADVGALALDLHRLAGPALARSFIAEYCRFSGEVHPSSLAHHYVALEAACRCVEAANQVAVGRLEFAAVARMYHRLCLDQLLRASARIVVVGGGPGSGKSTLADELGERFGWTVLASEEIRRGLTAGMTSSGPAIADQGVYAPEVTEACYDEMVREANLLLASGHSVVLDASWTDHVQREKVRSVADAHGAALVEFECRIDVATARERVARRLADGWTLANATPQVVDHLTDTRDPWPEATPLDSSEPVERTAHRAIAAIEAQCGAPTAPRVVPPQVDFWGGYTWRATSEPRRGRNTR